MENWDLIGKKLSGELTPDEAVRFEEWLRSDSSNETLWTDAQKVWAMSGKLDVSFDADTEKALAKVKSRRTVEKQLPVKPFFTPLKIAASVFFLAIPVFLIVYLSGDKKAEVVKQENSNATTPIVAEIKMLTMTATDSALSFYLPDSSHITLNKNSTFTYPEKFTAQTRSVTLSGEAFFDVRPDASKPFIIAAGNTETTVVGTSFNIREDKQNRKVEVTVISGKVRFKSKKESDQLGEITLLPQDHVVYTESKATMVKKKVKESEGYWWTKKVKAIRKMFKDAKKELRKPPAKKNVYRDSATKQFQISKRPL